MGYSAYTYDLGVGMGITASKFISAVVTSTDNIIALPVVYGGSLLLRFKDGASLADASGNYTFTVTYLD